ncbi:MAG: hypothetical protein KDK51_06370, partial [Deltaproteobacteria bacterium]|nr:hypothetical protein [Deltaproteobacteria bacterium]
MGHTKQTINVIAIIWMSLHLSYCGRELSGQGGGTITSTATHVKLGGTISGIYGPIIIDNGIGEQIRIEEDGVFEFTNLIGNDSSYDISIAGGIRGVTCDIEGGHGVVQSSQNITSIHITCQPICGDGQWDLVASSNALTSAPNFVASRNIAGDTDIVFSSPSLKHMHRNANSLWESQRTLLDINNQSITGATDIRLATSQSGETLLSFKKPHNTDLYVAHGAQAGTIQTFAINKIYALIGQGQNWDQLDPDAPLSNISNGTPWTVAGSQQTLIKYVHFMSNGTRMILGELWEDLQDPNDSMAQPTPTLESTFEHTAAINTSYSNEMSIVPSYLLTSALTIAVSDSAGDYTAVLLTQQSPPYHSYLRINHAGTWSDTIAANLRDDVPAEYIAINEQGKVVLAGTG